MSRKRRNDRRTGKLVLSAIVTATLVTWISAGLLSFRDEGDRGIGCRVNRSGTISMLSSLASSCDLRPYDVIRSITADGSTYLGAFNDVRIPHAGIATVELRRGRKSIDIALHPATSGDRKRRVGYFLIGVALSFIALIASVTAYIASRSFTALASAGFTTCVSVCIIALLSGTGASVLELLSIFAFGFLPATAWHLALVFPRRSSLAKSVPGVFRVIYASFFALSAVVASSTFLTADGRFLRFVEGLDLLALGLALGQLIWRSWRETRAPLTPLHAAQARAALMGLASAVGLPLMLSTLGTPLGLQRVELGALGIMLAPIPLGVVMNRTTFLDAGLQARQLSGHAVRGLSIAGLVAIGTIFAHYLLRGPLDMLTIATIWVATALITTGGLWIADSTAAKLEARHSVRLRRKLIGPDGELAVGNFLEAGIEQAVGSVPFAGFVRYPSETARRLEGMGRYCFDLHVGQLALAVFDAMPEIDLLNLADEFEDVPGIARLRESGVGLAFRLGSDENGDAVLVLAVPHRWPGFSSVQLAQLEEVFAQAAIALAYCWIAEAASSRSYFAARGQMAAEIAHDLKSPLECIQRIAERIDNSEIASIAADGNEIIDGFLVSETSSSRSLGAILSDAASEYSTAGNRDRILLRLAPNLPDMREATGIKRIVRNLLDNALEASPPGEIVELLCVEQSDEVLIEVRDSGRGMTREALSRAFEPLWSTKTGGTGLGLNSCLAIAEGLGGSISLDSKPGDGTRARVILPSRHAPLPSDRDVV